jgi:hypothetical protein
MPGSSYSLFVIPAHAGIQLSPTVARSLDDPLRSPCGPPYGRSTRYALLSGMRRNDEKMLHVPCLASASAFRSRNPDHLIEELGVMLNVVREAGESFGDPFQALE